MQTEVVVTRAIVVSKTLITKIIQQNSHEKEVVRNRNSYVNRIKVYLHFVTSLGVYSKEDNSHQENISNREIVEHDYGERDEHDVEIIMVGTVIVQHDAEKLIPSLQMLAKHGRTP